MWKCLVFSSLAVTRRNPRVFGLLGDEVNPKTMWGFEHIIMYIEWLESQGLQGGSGVGTV